MTGVQTCALPISTPLLIFYGIPPTVAVASATTQLTGTSVSGAHAHMRRGGVDLKMGGVMIVGGLLGSLVGAGLFRLLQKSGQIDLVISFLYVILLGGIGGLMLKDALVALGWVKFDQPTDRPRHNRWVAGLPLRWTSIPRASTSHRSPRSHWASWPGS